MTRSRLIAAVLIALLAAGAADAQKKAKKLYRWVDQDGKVHFSDSLPPEAVDQARQEISSTSGMGIREVDRALTDEERAAAAAAAAEAATAAELEEQQRRKDEAMLSSYLTEADLKRAYDDRIGLLEQTLEAGEVAITSQRASLATLLVDAAESELSGRKPDGKRAKSIRSIHKELVQQQQLQVRREAELAALGAEFEQSLARYRDLRKAQSSAAPPAGEGTEAAPPPAPAG